MTSTKAATSPERSAAAIESRIPRAAGASPLGLLRVVAGGDCGTPSRLAQFRARNWVGRKRALETTTNAAVSAPTSAVLPPKRRAVTALFTSDAVSEESDVNVVPENAAVEAAPQHTSQAEENETEANGEDDRSALLLQQELKVGRCLAHELSRDNARLKLKVDGLRDDIDYFYALLAKIEAAAATAASPSAALADAVQRVISAPKPERGEASSVASIT